MIAEESARSVLLASEAHSWAKRGSINKKQGPLYIVCILVGGRYLSHRRYGGFRFHSE
jgi:hypothetical protein